MDVNYFQITYLYWKFVLKFQLSLTDLIHDIFILNKTSFHTLSLTYKFMTSVITLKIIKRRFQLIDGVV